MIGMTVQLNGLLGWELLPSQAVTQYASTVQNALINVGTVRGQSRSLPEAGTNLLLDGQYGLMNNRQAAAHQANFAAAETMEWINQYTEDGSGISGMWLEIAEFAPPRLSLSVVVKLSDQSQFGTTIPVN